MPRNVRMSPAFPRKLLAESLVSSQVVASICNTARSALREREGAFWLPPASLTCDGVPRLRDPAQLRLKRRVREHRLVVVGVSDNRLDLPLAGDPVAEDVGLDPLVALRQRGA